MINFIKKSLVIILLVLFTGNLNAEVKTYKMVFVPASAASSLNIVVNADHNENSFASVNGTATFVVTITNDGDVDFTDVKEFSL